MSRRGKLLLIWVAPVIVLALLPVIAHYRAKSAAEKFKAQLRAQGEKLTIDELVPRPPPDTPNGATALLKAMSRLTSFDYELQPGAMKMLEPAHARICWQQDKLPTEKSEDIWPALRAYLETNRVALAELREAIGQPVLYFPVDYHQTFVALLPHLAPMKSMSQRLSAAAIAAMRDQRTEEAFAILQALVGLPAHHREEPFMISQLVRCAIIAIAANAAWEGVHYPHWSEEQLAQLQILWESIEVLPQMNRALAMERACVLVEYVRVRDSMKRLDAFTGGGGNALGDLSEVGTKMIEDPGEGLEDFIDRFPRRWIWPWWNSYEDEVWYLQAIQRNLNEARAAIDGKPFVQLHEAVEAEERRVGEPPSQYLLVRLLRGALFPAVKRAVIVETQRRVVVTAIALERHKRRSGKLPGELNALVPAFLAVVPVDPMDGQPLRYRSTGPNSFVLYSIGPDGVDGNGDASPMTPGSKILHWTQCKDIVWPQPATVEQLREFNLQLEQKRGTKRR